MITLLAKAHTLSLEDITKHFEVDPKIGLSTTEAKLRQESFGPNALPITPPRSPWFIFFGQFKSIIILILIGAIFLSALIGNIKDALVILAVVLVNASVGFYQEYRAEQSLETLKNMMPTSTHVRRDGKKQQIDSQDVVPGDIVLLEAGDSVPADGRFFLSFGAEVDESSLTGESQPIAKHTTLLQEPHIPLGDRVNMAYMNTMLTRGRAEIIVTAVGAETQMGRLSHQLALATEPPTPLQIQLDQLAKVLGAIALTLVAILSFLELLRGTKLVHIALDAIAISVAALPEGLPVVVTVTLALGMHKMAQRNAIVKRLASVETLGCTTVICSDKTGTLTLNQMTAKSFFYLGRRFEVSGEGYSIKGEIKEKDSDLALPDLEALLIPLAGCNDSRIHDDIVLGDPMEGALLVLAQKGGVTQTQVHENMPRIAEIPFDAKHKYMATFHQKGDEIHIFVKGAPDVLVSQVTKFLFEDEAEIDKEYLALATDGLRGIMVATRTILAKDFTPKADLTSWIEELTFIGLIGLMDPPRSEAKEAISLCKDAGIMVKMITGDHKATGYAIAKELGLEGDAITGAELDKMSSTQLSLRINDIAVFARVNPAHKVKIVRALQAKKHVVAMTGDGVNDAPALKSADIGIAMGIAGTAVAKEAASMVLLDDNFTSIVSAVRHGRTLYDNILKFVRFQLSTTVGMILTLFFAPFLGFPEPFTTIEILWVAIIMDGPPAISLALDTSRPGIMLEKPRGRLEAMLSITRIIKVMQYGVIMTLGTLGILYYGLESGSEQRALTMAFTTFVLFQVFNLFNARNEYGSAFNKHMFDNKMLWLSLFAVITLQIIAVHLPVAKELFGTGEMHVSDWGISALVASSVLLFEELCKLLFRKKQI